MPSVLTLATTKIGDLLINREISTPQEGQSINNITLKIPPYQRPYKWKPKNANQLLDDIIQAQKENKEVYRVGTLILHQDTATGMYNIVDGQQRIITFSLLLYIFLKKEIEFLKEELTNNPSNRENVSNNYRGLQRRINNIVDESEKKKLYDYITNNCELIVIITDNISEAFQFFDSQNARGKKLFPHDLLKAYHLREMLHLDVAETEKIVKIWEDLEQTELSILFKDYLYRIKEWAKGNKPDELTEHNIDIFKGVSQSDTYPYACFYKGAFCFADDVNRSNLSFVTGASRLPQFQLLTPIIAGKPFFEYTKHYFDILKDIKNNNKYEGYFINDNEIVKTLDMYYMTGVGNKITRLLFDAAILLYVDRFCPEKPSKAELELLNQFVVYAFVWAYSMRAQYQRVGWSIAQNYVMGEKNVKNAFNLYKEIADAHSPGTLLNDLADRVQPLSPGNIPGFAQYKNEEQSKNPPTSYLDFFEKYKFLNEEKSNEQK